MRAAEAAMSIWSYLKTEPSPMFRSAKNAADGAGTTASSMTPVSEYNTGQWYDLTLVFRGVNGGMLGKELAVYDVYLDGKQIITAAPFCQTNGKVNQSSIQAAAVHGA